MDGGMDEKRRERGQGRERDDSYLHPRQLVYKSSPERRKGGNKKQNKTKAHQRCSHKLTHAQSNPAPERERV